MLSSCVFCWSRWTLRLFLENFLHVLQVLDERQDIFFLVTSCLILLTLCSYFCLFLPYLLANEGFEVDLLLPVLSMHFLFKELHG